MAEPDSAKFGTSNALIAGMCRGLSDAGYTVGGFDACTTSDVLRGSGLSSSAAFEDMVGTILSHLYNNGRVDNVTISKLAQYAEKVVADAGHLNGNRQSAGGDHHHAGDLIDIILLEGQGNDLAGS